MQGPAVYLRDLRDLEISNFFTPRANFESMFGFFSSRSSRRSAGSSPFSSQRKVLRNSLHERHVALQEGTLHVTLQSAQGLRAADRSGFSDPCALDPESHSSEGDPCALDPSAFAIPHLRL